jgi:flagellar protein FliO/FliZ
VNLPIVIAAEAISSAPALPDVGVSALRVIGALLLVLALFFGGVWLFKNSQRMYGGSGRGSKLSVLEAKSLGNRQALYVVGYGRQRILLGASPSGVTLVSQLPEASTDEEAVPSTPNFAQALQSVLNRRS